LDKTGPKGVNHQPPHPSDRMEIAREFPESGNLEARQFGQKADQAFQTGHLEAAANGYQAAIRADAHDIRAHYNLGVISYYQEKWDTAHACFDRCIHLRPEDADLHFKQGLCILKQGGQEATLQAFTRAQDLDSDHLRARFQLALLYASGTASLSRDRRKAIENLEYILEACDREIPFAHLDRVCFLLGSFLDDHPDQQGRAIAIYRRGLKVDPLFAPGHNNLGVLLMKAGQTLPALGEFKIAIHLEPDYTLPYVNLARLLFDHMSSVQMEREYATITEEFGIRAASVLSRLSLELINLGRAQVYESLYTHGHRIKNLMGVSGSRMRRVIRDLQPETRGLDELKSIAQEQEQIYNQWVAYLRSMKQQAMNLTLVDPTQLVQRVAQTLAFHKGQKTLNFASEARVPQVKADVGMLKEAITNLILNALEVIETSGRVIVQVGYDPERGSVYVEVEDNGPGIPEHLQVRIFDPGYSTREKGNGYGLSICSRIVSAHRGTLRVISQPGEGAVFRIDLPIDFELTSEEESIGLQRPLSEASRDPIAEEFIE